MSIATKSVFGGAAPIGSASPAAVVSAVGGMSPEEKAASRAALDVQSKTVPHKLSAVGAVSRNIGTLLNERCVNVKDFLQEGVTITQAIQKAIDVAAHLPPAYGSARYPTDAASESASSAVVFLPTFGGGVYETDDTLHIGYGFGAIVTIVIEGEIGGGIWPGNGRRACIKPLFNDRPCINIQGSRRCVLRNLTLVGVNYEYLATNYNTMTDRTNRANWIGPALSAESTDRYSPYCGLAIDAYAGTTPPTPYPNVTFPSWIGSSVPQYGGKWYTSQVTLENVFIGGFVVGIMAQPGVVPDASQGDFLRVTSCTLEYNLEHYACGHSDNRLPKFDGTMLWSAFTVFDGLTYGNQRGTMHVAATGCCFDGVVKVFNADMGGYTIQGGYPMGLDHCYGEGMHSLGVGAVSGGQKRGGGLSVRNAKFSFSVRSGEVSPVYIYDAVGTEARFENVTLAGGYAFHRINANLTADGIVLDKVIADVFTAGSSPAGKRAASYLCGVHAPKVRRAVVKPLAYFSAFGYTLDDIELDSERFDIGMMQDAGHANWSWYGLPIPHFINYLTSRNSRLPVSSVPTITLDRATYNLSSLTKTNSEHTFTVNTGFITDSMGSNAEPDFAVGLGDFAIDPATGVCWFVKSVSFAGSGSGATMTCTLRQLNSIRSINGTDFFTSVTLSANSGTLVFHNARRVYPSPFRVNMSATAGSGNITMRISGDEAGKVSMTLPARVGDYLISNHASETPAESVFPKFSKITASTPNSGTFTVAQNARRDYYGEAILLVRNMAVL